MIDWDAVVLGPVMGVFGGDVIYTPAGGSPIALKDAVFDDGFAEIDPIGRPGVMSSSPTLGVRVAALPPGWDAIEAQDDTFVVVKTGRQYVVKSGEPDSHGHALLRANLAP